MCLDCGCGDLDNDHGNPAHLTIADLQAAADASGISLVMAASNVLRTVTGTLGDDEPQDGPEDQFLYGAAYQAGPSPLIRRGADGGLDMFSARELEKAAWSFMLGGHQHGLFHADGTEGIAKTVESGIYRNPVPWVISDDLIIRRGDWTLGVLVNDEGWALYKQGKIGGLSPQGAAKRRSPTLTGTD
jgi:hypothetical protein